MPRSPRSAVPNTLQIGEAEQFDYIVLPTGRKTRLEAMAADLLGCLGEELDIKRYNIRCWPLSWLESYRLAGASSPLGV